ncbi:MAG: folate-binding protein YgfZ [Gammaproteobacteria bacterium]|nr:folate-binding protein YgfZ [Gammaproteobacteria bacterium]
MHASWLNFMQRHGARFSADGVTHYGDPAAELRAAEHGTLLADLSQEGLIRVDGEDARAFLQGQLSTDLLALTPLSSQLSSWNNAKGRVVTLLRLSERDGAIYMTLPQALATRVLKRLAMYVLRSKASLTDVSDTLAHFGVAGRNAPDLLAACDWPAPAGVNAVAVKDGVTLIRLHGDIPRFVLQGEPDKLISLWHVLEGKGAHPAGNGPWALLRILAREPVVHPETSEHFVAQMLGLEELGAIDFKKGCYIGQEVIARAHYRGAVKRHLNRASCASSQPIPPGTPLYANGTEQAAGEVVDARQDSNGIIQMLIVIQDEYRTAPLSLPTATAITLIG